MSLLLFLKYIKIMFDTILTGQCDITMLSIHGCACYMQLLPFLVALTLFVITVFIIQTGAKNKQ